MKKDHLAESTIKMTDRKLKLIAKTVNLNDPDKVTEYLANKEGKNGYIYSHIRTCACVFCLSPCLSLCRA